MRMLHTIGHSSHPPEHFVGLLRQHGIQVVADTRSTPYSRYTPQFDRESLGDMLASAGVKYLYLGGAVGGRPAGPGAAAWIKPAATSAAGPIPR